MPLERFVDVITDYISLRVKKDPISPRLDHLSSFANIQTLFSPVSTSYVSNQSKTHVSLGVDEFVTFTHAYMGLTSAAFIGTPNVLNITALHIMPTTLEQKALHSFRPSSQTVLFPQGSPAVYNGNTAFNIYSSETALNVSSAADTLLFNYEKQRNIINVKEISFENPSNSGGSNGNNNTNLLKEFWA